MNKNLGYFPEIFFAAAMKVFIGPGYSRKDPELLSLPSDSFPPTCKTPPAYPIAGVSGTVVAEILGRVTVCGGRKSINMTIREFISHILIIPGHLDKDPELLSLCTVVIRLRAAGAYLVVTFPTSC